MSIIKKTIFSLLILSWIGVSFAVAPSFDQNFAKYLTSETPDEYGRVETVFNICIYRDKTLMENIKNLFYPGNPAQTPTKCGGAGGQLRDVIRVLGFAILFIFLVVAWMNFIMNAKEADGAKKAWMSLIYIGYGAFLVFGVTRILGSVLNIGGLQWTNQLVQSVQNNLFLQILSFFKVLAFFFAIVMIIIYGFRVMASMDQSDKIKTIQKWILNVLLALVFIKLIDYIFFIAQTPEFGAKASDLIVDIARILWFVLGAALVIAVFYAGFLFITSWGKEETFKKATWFIVNVFIVSMVIFLFLLIVYQIFREFAGTKNSETPLSLLSEGRNQTSILKGDPVRCTADHHWFFHCPSWLQSSIAG